MFGLPLGGFIGLILLAIFFLNWIKVLNEYERGVIFRLGKLLPHEESSWPAWGSSCISSIGRGRICVDFRLQSHRPHGEDESSPGRARRSAPGCDHARQRFGEGKRGDFFPRRSPDQSGGRGGELSLCDFSACANDAPQRPRSSGVRWSPIRTERLNMQLQDILDKHTDPWGIKSPPWSQAPMPAEMTRALAKQAEAERRSEDHPR